MFEMLIFDWLKTYTKLFCEIIIYVHESIPAFFGFIGFLVVFR